MTPVAELGLLGIARRAGHVVVGAQAVKSAARRGKVAALVIAEDASENALARLGALSEELPRVALGTRESLGRAVGRGEVAIVGITDRRLAERIVSAQAALEDEREDDIGAESSPRRQVR